MKNVIFKTLKIQNFLSFGKEVTIPIVKGLNLITGTNIDKNDANGVGKSAIVDAFFFAIFGETLKELKKENIVNHLAKKNCKVTLDFDINKNGVTTNYIIERGLAPSFCKLTIDGTEDKTLATIPITNNFILNLINSTSTVFRNSITMGINNSTPFMAFGKGEKRKFVEGLLRLELFSIMTKVAKDNHDIIFKEYEMVIQSYEENNRNIQIYIERKNNYEKSRLDKINDYTTRINQHLDEMKTLNDSIIPFTKKTKTNTVECVLKALNVQEKIFNDIVKEIIVLENKQSINIGLLNQYTQQLNQTKEIFNMSKIKLPKLPKTPDECQQWIIDETKKITETQEKITELQFDIKNLKNEIEKIEKLGIYCDKCMRPFAQEDIEKKKNDLTCRIQGIEDKQKSQADLNNILITRRSAVESLKLITKMFELNAQQKLVIEDSSRIAISLEHKQTCRTAAENDVCKTKEDLKILQEQEEKDRLQEERNRSIMLLADNHKKAAEQYSKDLIKTKHEKNEFAEILITSETKKLEMEKRIEEFKEKVAIYDVIKFAVSDNGLRSFIIKRLLNMLNEKIAYYLVKLDANCKLKFNEFFEDTIINDKNVECSYHNFSGGERKRIDFACLFAFMDLRRIQGDVSFNVAFYDELVDSALSANGSKNMFDIFKERIDKWNESAYIITHRKEYMKNSLINNIVYLEKSGGITRLANISTGI